MAKIKTNNSNNSNIHANVVNNDDSITSNVSNETINIQTGVITESNNINSNVVNRKINVKSNANSNFISVRSIPSTYPSATETKKGIIRIATEEETIDGIDTETAITPHTLKLATHYTHIQGVASDKWIITHNLNKKPSITVVDSAGNVVEGAEKYINENVIEIYFNGAFKGEAYLN